jgi:hypothetical protein
VLPSNSVVSASSEGLGAALVLIFLFKGLEMRMGATDLIPLGVVKPTPI